MVGTSNQSVPEMANDISTKNGATERAGLHESEECSQGDGSTRRPPAVPMGKTGSSEFSSQCAF